MSEANAKLAAAEVDPAFLKLRASIAERLRAKREELIAQPLQFIWGALAEEAIAALAPPADAWRPIETAPKDGTEIILYSPLGNEHFTCWQPLPAPPTGDHT